MMTSPLLSVDETLDKFHKAASEADGETYFSLFATQQLTPSYFMGTDATERWTVDEFKAYAMPHFSQGKGWTYKPRSRNVSYSCDKCIAWFDELLDSERFGVVARGTGVLVREDDVLNENQKAWRITQYNLTIPVPNALIETTARMIRELRPESDA